MIFEKYYSEIEKVNFENYNIDDKHNLFVLENLEKLIRIFNKSKINFIISGNIAWIFLYKKMYRNIGDIDIVIPDTDIHKIMDIIYLNKYELIFKNYTKCNPIVLFKNNICINIFKNYFFSKQNCEDKNSFFFKKFENFNLKFFRHMKVKRYPLEKMPKKVLDDLRFFEKYT
jgi:hypothetical protein